MAENTVKIDISFQSLLEAIASLGMTEKHQLWELLEAELFSENEDSPEDREEIQAARNDYQTGNYMTFEQYLAQRTHRSV